MAFYVFKSGGTATGDAGRYATQQTGTFAALGVANYYDDVDAAFAATTPPASGDFIQGSDAHTNTNTGASAWAITAAINTELVIMSVSDTAIDQASAGATESWNNGLDLTVTGSVTFHGMNFSIGDDLNVSTSSRVKFIDCDITLSGSGDRAFLNADGACLLLDNTTITTVVTNESTGINLSNGNFEMIGGSIVDGGAAMINLIQIGQNGDIDINIVGANLSTITGTIVQGFGATDGDDVMRCRIQGCAINAGAAFTDEAFGHDCQSLLATNSSSTSAAGLYQFYQQTYGGTVEEQDDTGIHRDETTAFTDGTKVSFKCITKANTTTTRPLEFDLPTRFAALSSASTDTIRIYFASTATLTDNDVWAELYYPDGTNNHVYNRVSNQNTDILAAGTEHTDDSGVSTWKDGVSDLTAHNEYRMDLDTSADVGADSVPIIRIHCAVASATIYFDTTVDVVT